jgi:hypothetical protein
MDPRNYYSPDFVVIGRGTVFFVISVAPDARNFHRPRVSFAKVLRAREAAGKKIVCPESASEPYTTPRPTGRLRGRLALTKSGLQNSMAFTVPSLRPCRPPSPTGKTRCVIVWYQPNARLNSSNWKELAPNH